jgi:hypothetical protein
MVPPLLPELRPYLEGVLEDGLSHSSMTIHQQARREWMLCLLQKELVRFVFTRLMNAFPASQRRQFTALLEQQASEAALQAFTMRHVVNIPAFVVQSFQEFRAHYLPSESKQP